MSDVQIAEHVGVNDKTVAKYRAELCVTSEIPKSAERIGRDGRTINVEKIGKTAAPVADAETVQHVGHGHTS